VHYSPLFTALDFPLTETQFKAVRTLLWRGADVLLVDGQGKNVLHQAICSLTHCSMDVDKSMLSRSAMHIYGNILNMLMDMTALHI
jgi:hypothetical protein